MSATVTAASTLRGSEAVLEAMAPVSRRIRGFFAPVDRITGTPAIFDPATMAGLSMTQMPAPWLELGVCRNFVRRSETKVNALRVGSPASAYTQTRLETGATVEFEFESWSKLALALSAGVQQMNVLAPAAGATTRNSGGTPAATAVPVQTGSDGATTISVGEAAADGFAVGSMVVVDVDYVGQTGYVGSGASGGYVRSSSSVHGDVDYIRRISLNVGVVVDVSDGVLTLAKPLLAGAPVAGMRVSRVLGFVDREGDGFAHEWSDLFCMDGAQGDRVMFFYPRLQTVTGAAEISEVLGGTQARMQLKSVFRALATKDATDGSQVVCYRSYVPAAMRASQV